MKKRAIKGVEDGSAWIADTIYVASKADRRPGLDLLDEMAAMEVPNAE